MFQTIYSSSRQSSLRKSVLSHLLLIKQNFLCQNIPFLVKRFYKNGLNDFLLASLIPGRFGWKATHMWNEKIRWNVSQMQVTLGFELWHGGMQCTGYFNKRALTDNKWHLYATIFLHIDTPLLITITSPTLHLA